MKTDDTKLRVFLGLFVRFFYSNRLIKVVNWSELVPDQQSRQSFYTKPVLSGKGSTSI